MVIGRQAGTRLCKRNLGRTVLPAALLGRWMYVWRCHYRSVVYAHVSESWTAFDSSSALWHRISNLDNQSMTRHSQLRRASSVVAMVAGAILIFLAPNNAWVGIAMILLGVAIELLGIVLRHPHDNEKP